MIYIVQNTFNLFLDLETNENESSSDGEETTDTSTRKGK